MKKNFVSNSEDSKQMFKNNLMEGLSKVHYSVPLFIFLPVITFFIVLAFSNNIGLPGFIVFFLIGLLVWTATEYLLHRFIFHYHPGSEFGKKIHFIFHGVHHDYPKDKKRLVMPPAVSIPLAASFYFLFSLIFQPGQLYAFFPGFLLGYLCYDMLHYAMHHYNFKSGIMKRVKQHHMLHHYHDPENGFGVSTALWDNILRSRFSDSPKKLNEQQ